MWVENVNGGRCEQSKFVPVKDSHICSEHFSADMFEESHGEKAVLNPYYAFQAACSGVWLGDIFCRIKC
jgi:hypothetical protein